MFIFAAVQHNKAIIAVVGGEIKTVHAEIIRQFFGVFAAGFVVAADIDDRHGAAAKITAEFHDIFTDFFFKHQPRHRVAEQNHAVVIARVRHSLICLFKSCVPVRHAQPRLIFAARRGKRIAFGLHFFAEPAAVAVSFQNAH